MNIKKPFSKIVAKVGYFDPKKKISIGILIVAIIILIYFQLDNRKTYNGYIDADMTYLSGSYPGRLLELAVKRGEFVEKGRLVFRIDQSNDLFDAELDKANLEALSAKKQEVSDQLKYAETYFKRQKLLSKTNAANQDEIEMARKNSEVLTSKLREVEANIQGAKIRDSKTRWLQQQKDGIAPEDGLLFDIYKTVGEYSASGQPIVSLIGASKVKLIFYVAEPELGSIGLGQKMDFYIDGSEGYQLAIVEYISSKAEYTPPIIFSRDQRKKLVYKIIAKPEKVDFKSLHLGQPVTVSAAKQ